jgi:hypothetical protein
MAVIETGAVGSARSLSAIRYAAALTKNPTSHDTILPKRQVRLATSIGAVVLAALSLCDCVGGKRQSRRCEWPAETPRRLDLAQSADRAHLRRDAESAETIAIHYADVSPARRKGRREYDQARDECMASLFGTVARTHGLDIGLVRGYTAVRNELYDAIVLLSFTVLYAFTAHTLAGRLARRFRADERNVAVLAAIGLSFSSALVAMMVFPLWAETVESVRLGSWHLSYRAERLPWRHHPVLLFTSCVGLFLVISFLRYSRSPRRAGGELRDQGRALG